MNTTGQFMRDPIRILAKRDELTLQGIKQFYVFIPSDRYEFETLCDLYESRTHKPSSTTTPATPVVASRS